MSTDGSLLIVASAYMWLANYSPAVALMGHGRAPRDQLEVEVVNVSLEINGRSTTVDVEPSTPLLWVIREAAGLTGTKFGCGTGQCGACTVHLDGEPVRSCSVPVMEAEGREITTIEGVDGEVAAAVRASWLALDVTECGYCQAGQIMSAVALLAGTSRPTDADIDQAMRGNICRCGIYDRIRTAVHAAARTLET